MTGHWVLLLILKLVLCGIGACAILVFSFAVGLFDVPPDDHEAAR